MATDHYCYYYYYCYYHDADYYHLLDCFALASPLKQPPLRHHGLA